MCTSLCISRMPLNSWSPCGFPRNSRPKRSISGWTTAHTSIWWGLYLIPPGVSHEGNHRKLLIHVSRNESLEWIIKHHDFCSHFLMKIPVEWTNHGRPWSRIILMQKKVQHAEIENSKSMVIHRWIIDFQPPFNLSARMVTVESSLIQRLPQRWLQPLPCNRSEVKSPVQQNMNKFL